MTRPPARRLRALLFDFDHTLADLGRWVDWSAARAAIATLYRGHGVDPDAVTRGHGALRVIDALHDALAARGPRALADAARVEAFAILEAHERVGAARAGFLPGAAAALATARARGVALAIVSANAESAIRLTLERLGAAGLFAAIVGRAPTRALKPAPDMYEEALAALGCAPAEALVVGDSRNDMRGATAAGIAAVGVEGGEGVAGDLFQAGAVWVLADLTALPTLLAFWEGAAQE